jgi:hypothetical protein
MSYPTETDLVENFKKRFLEVLPKSKNFVALREVNTTWGIVDLLVVAVRQGVMLRRQSELGKITAPPLTNHAALSLVWLQNRRHSDISSLGDFLRICRRTAKITAENLAQRGLVRLHKNGAIHLRSPRQTLIIDETFAFEAKLRKWQKVVDQAERHLWFTNSSYVVMPQLRCETLKTVSSACKKRGIGFITMETCDRFSIQQKPPNTDHVDSHFKWKLNEFLIDQWNFHETSASRQTASIPS